ncbi:hypothetical protein V9K67_26870 [Paraflavisolibacter sp. H34]|uniref:hypothetical protein n=1 Tax=Huijunlia imazamoxiresistens TaxID=3127457 RepID=UPI0030176FC4
MDTHKEFEILIRRRIPYLNNALFGVAFFLCVALFILYVIMLPTRYASGEMATAYYILVIPKWLKTVSAYSVVGFSVTFWLYYNMRLYKSAILIFHPKELAIVGKHINLHIPFRKIEKVYCKGFVTFSSRRKKAPSLYFNKSSTNQQHSS